MRNLPLVPIRHFLEFGESSLGIYCKGVEQMKLSKKQLILQPGKINSFPTVGKNNWVIFFVESPHYCPVCLQPQHASSLVIWIGWIVECSKPIARYPSIHHAAAHQEKRRVLFSKMFFTWFYGEVRKCIPRSLHVGNRTLF